MSLRTRGAVACAVVLLVAGCGDEPPEIDAPDLSAADASACRDLVAALPDELAGQERVDVTGDTEYGAAWGDPAIVLTCGVGRPDDFTDISTCASGVDRSTSTVVRVGKSRVQNVRNASFMTPNSDAERRNTSTETTRSNDDPALANARCTCSRTFRVWVATSPRAVGVTPLTYMSWPL